MSVALTEVSSSPSNDGDGRKKKGKFKRLMNWVDKKICGGGTPAQAASNTLPAQSREKSNRSLSPLEQAERQKNQEKLTELHKSKKSVLKIAADQRRGSIVWKLTANAYSPLRHCPRKWLNLIKQLS